MLTDDQLKGSFFYAAAGIDPRPLQIFGQSIDTFIYCDWNVDEPQAVGAFHGFQLDSLRLASSRALDLNDFGRTSTLSVLRNPRLRGFDPARANLDCQHLAHLELTKGFQLSTGEESSYCHWKIGRTGVTRPWGRLFEFSRVSARPIRPVRLLYFSDEALARYCLLYVARRLAPAIACTVQSSGFGWTCLEQPSGVFERFLLRCPTRPSSWIRGGVGGPRLGASAWSKVTAAFPDWSAAQFTMDQEGGGNV